MSVRSFHSVFMATAVAGAALGCYLVSLRVASERAALEQVERQIVQTQRDIRLVQTEIGTRARLAQLERWNVRVLALSAPSAEQILGDRFQLASLVAPERRPAVEAPVVLAAAPARQAEQPLAIEPGPSPASLLREASLQVPSREEASPKPAAPSPKAASAKLVEPASKSEGGKKAPAEKLVEAKPGREKKAKAEASNPIQTAKVDPLAPLPAGASTAKGSRTQR